jgi:hypothetical protein
MAEATARIGEKMDVKTPRARVKQANSNDPIVMKDEATPTRGVGDTGLAANDGMSEK